MLFAYAKSTKNMKRNMPVNMKERGTVREAFLANSAQAKMAELRKHQLDFFKLVVVSR